jgi:hypothetical protein
MDLFTWDHGVVQLVALPSRSDGILPEIHTQLVSIMTQSRNNTSTVQPFAHSVGALFINESKNYFPASSNLLHYFPHPVDSFRKQTTTMRSPSPDQEMAAVPGNQSPSSEEVIIISGTVLFIVPLVCDFSSAKGNQQGRKSSADGFCTP